MIRKLIPVLLTIAVGLFGCKKNEKPMNFVVFLIDDMGWTDLGCYGSDLYETPNIDRLAAEGIRFTQGYAACTVCSPTRAAIMTGKYPARINLTDWISGHKRPYAKLQVPDWQMYLDTTERTVAELLRERGYATASVGKWHLGDDPAYWPPNQGFDVNIGGYRYGAPGSYFYPYHGNRRDRKHPPNLSAGDPGEYLTHRLTEEAEQFIRANRDSPFFLYLPYYAVHTPLQAPDSLTAHYREKMTPGALHNNPVYAAMVHSVDQGVGAILDLLESEDLSGNTVVFFTSDNGGLVLRDVTDNTPLRSGKGSPYEGGVRVPVVIKHPGLESMGQTCTVPVVTMDLPRTILSLCGIEAHAPDGMDLTPLLEDPNGRRPGRALYWHYPHYHPGGATPYSAIRSGRYRLIEFFEDGRLELYDLESDLGEQQDLSKAKPDIAANLLRNLRSWRAEMDAQLPRVNPNHRPGQ